MKVRPRIQRAFLAWLAEAKPRLDRQVQLRHRTDPLLTFGFDVGDPVLQGRLSSNSLMVTVQDGGICWDILIDLDAFPERREGGVVCGMCPLGERRVFADREELWRDHLFEPFLAWVNEKLAPSTGLALFGSPSDGITWAELVGTLEAAGAAKRAILLNKGPSVS